MTLQEILYGTFQPPKANGRVHVLHDDPPNKMTISALKRRRSPMPSPKNKLVTKSLLVNKWQSIYDVAKETGISTGYVQKIAMALYQRDLLIRRDLGSKGTGARFEYRKKDY